MKYIKEVWFLILILFTLSIVYIVLWSAGIVPLYQCSSTMGPEGPVQWCMWVKGYIGMG